MVTVRENTAENKVEKEILEKELSNLWYKITIVYIYFKCVFITVFEYTFLTHYNNIFTD